MLFSYLKILFFLLIFASISHSDVISTTGVINFETNGQQTQMTLNSTGLGIGTSNPSSKLQVNGNTLISQSLGIGGTASSNLSIQGTIGFGLMTISDNQTLNSSSYNLIDSSSGNIIIELPYAGNVTGRTYTIKKISPQYDVTLKGGGNYIDLVEQVLITESNQLVSGMTLMSDGKQWRVLSQPETGVTFINPYSPSDNTLALWFDAADSSSIMLNSGNVSQWNDKSGNDDHAIQTDPTKQPTYINKSKLSFDGSEFLLASNIDNLNSWSGNRTIAMVVSYGSSASNTILHWGPGTSTYRDEQIIVSSNQLQLKDDHNSGSPNFTSTSTENVENGMIALYSVHNTGSAFKRLIRFNGNTALNNSSNRTSDINPDSKLYIGYDFDGSGYRTPGSYAKDVYLHEVIIYPNHFSLTDLQKIEGYLMHKWNLSDKFDTSHPYFFHQPISD